MHGRPTCAQVFECNAANAGIGRPTARVLLERGATVVMACRNMSKALKAKQGLIDELAGRDQYKGDELLVRLDVIKLDLASLRWVDSFVSQLETLWCSMRASTRPNGRPPPTDWRRTSA